MSKLVVRKFVALLTVASFAFQLLTIPVAAQRGSKGGMLEAPDRNEVPVRNLEESLSAKGSRIAPDLEEKTTELEYGLRSNEFESVIIQLKSDTVLNEVLTDAIDTETRKSLFAKEVRSNRLKTESVKGHLNVAGGRFKKAFNSLGLISAELPLSKIKELAQSENVEYISPDAELQTFGHVGNTIGWTNNGIRDMGDADPNTWLTGNYGSLVIIDSGIDPNHNLTRWMNTGGQSKVAYRQDFTGQAVTGDTFGHGTHVASMAAGDWVLGNEAYEGLADGAPLIDLRVLNGLGSGSVSNLIAALDWTVANKTAWNIRVVNLSLGTPAKDSYRNDPLCLAARRAVNAGIVVVASAGNFGKDIFGRKLYGTIGSPGIEPSVLTVGAANTFGTDFRSDDVVATFSSKGPTRGYRTLANGARKYDNLIKPDIVAPGNKLIGARAYYNGTENFLTRTFTTLRAGASVNNSEKVMYLSGTSMAAPIVAGAAMNLIQTNPNLTPNLIKAILMYSAQPIPNHNTFEQGAGLLNVDGAVRIARLVKTTLPTTNGAAMLKSALPASQTSVISGQTVYWGKGLVTNHGLIYGNDLMNKWQGMYANGVLISDGTPFSGTTIARSTSLTNGTLSLYQGAIKNNGVLISDGTLFASANAMGGTPTPVVNGQGVLVADGILIADGVLVGDGVLISDGNAYSTSVLGDSTSCMIPVH